MLSLFGIQRDLIEALSQGASPSDALKPLMDALRHLDDDLICSTLQLRDQRLWSLETSQLPARYSAAIEGIAIGDGVGSCGTAAYRGETVISPDIAHDPAWATVTDVAAEAGLAACWSVPIRGHGGQILGTFALYHRRPRTPQGDELALMEAVARITGAVLDSGLVANTLAAERRALVEDRALLSALLDNNPDLVFFKDLEGRYGAANATFLTWVGRDAGEVLGRTDHDLFPREQAEFFRAHDRRALESPQPHQNEEWLDWPDGARLVEMKKTAVRTPDGAPLGVLGVGRDVTHHYRDAERLRVLADTDALTQLPNRRALWRRARALFDTRAPTHPVSVAMIDIDRFKVLNDTAGHEAGDRALAGFAACLKAEQGPDDIIGRIGGEEFAWLSPGAPVDALAARVARARERAWGEHGLRFSAGLTAGTEGDFEDTLRRADRALYAAKTSGRDQSVID